MDKLDTLQRIIDKAEHIVFFGGAGVSAASGIPDFASRPDIPFETILSHDYFINETEKFFDFYKNNMLFPHARPNAVHYALASLEKRRRLAAVITQNVDGLHRGAGSNRVFELHGNVNYNYCQKCGKSYDLGYILSSKGIPRCSCGGIVKPDVLLYGEPMDRYMLDMAAAYAMSADVFIVGGTSLAVQPAAGIAENYLGSRLVLINKTDTYLTDRADLVINEDIEKVFKELSV